MLNKIGENGHPCLVPDLRGNAFSFLLYDVSCEFVICGLYYIEVCSLYAHFLESFHQNDYTTQGSLQLQCNPYQTTNGIFHRTKTKKKNCMETLKGPQIANSFFRKKNRARGIRIHVIKLYHKATVIKTVWYQHQNRNTDQ